MRHHSKIKSFGRKRSQRVELMRTLAVSLIEHGRIKTTKAKAKAVRPFVEKLVTKAKKQDNKLATYRLLISRLHNETMAKKLIDEIAPKYTERPGGYTRVLKLPRRPGDAAELAIIEFV